MTSHIIVVSPIRRHVQVTNVAGKEQFADENGERRTASALVTGRFESKKHCILHVKTVIISSLGLLRVSRIGKTTVSVLHDAQLLLNKQQQIWGGVYIH